MGGDQHDEFGFLNVISVSDEPVVTKRLSQADTDDAMQRLGPEAHAEICGEEKIDKISIEMKNSCAKSDSHQSVLKNKTSHVVETLLSRSNFATCESNLA